MFSTVDLSTWPGAIFVLGVLALGVLLLIVIVSSYQEFWNMRHRAAERDELRSLVQRYEQLASGTLDAQQRTAADVAELRARTSSVEQILRSVE